MFYGNVSISQYSFSNLLIWFTMAFQAGILNIGGFFVAKKLVSHVTGFATFFGYDMSQGAWGHALGMLLVPFFFLFGAMVSGYFVDVRLKLGKRAKYYITFGLMFVLNLVIVVTGVLGGWGEFGQYPLTLEGYILLTMLCFLCGIQNGTITTVSKSVVRTTHLTGITTDLGIGIMRMIFQGRMKEKLVNEKQANYTRIGIIVSFVFGSVVGGYLFHRYAFFGFILPLGISGCLFFLMMYFQVWQRPST